jgi:hypothetical protein
MEKEEFIKQFRGLLTVNNPLTEIDTLLQKAVNSGAVYIAGEPEESYRLCKIVYYAILSEMCNHWKPTDRQHIKEAKNLQLFL